MVPPFKETPISSSVRCFLEFSACSSLSFSGFIEPFVLGGGQIPSRELRYPAWEKENDLQKFLRNKQEDRHAFFTLFNLCYTQEFHLQGGPKNQ